ncbi:MAG: monovalent cation/H+ antiporter complex subunit F [Phycisphaeraceae bacterium]
MSLLSFIPWLLLAAAPATGVEPAAETAQLSPFLLWAVDLGVVTLVAGIVLCVVRILIGPHLATRVLAADALSLHVVGLIVVLAIRLETLAFFDVALVVAIIGFASTLAFAQYIGARPGRANE